MKTSTPQPINTHREFAVIDERHQQLRSELNALVAQQRALEQRLLAVLTRDENVEIERISSAIVEGSEIGPMDTEEQLHAEIAAIKLKIAGYRRADVLLRAEKADVRAALSVDAARLVEPKHRAAVRRMVDAIDAFEAALVEAATIRASLSKLGYDPCLPEFSRPLGISLDDYVTTVWISNAREYSK